MDGEISPNDFHPMKQRTEKTLTGLELKLKNLKKTTSPFKTFINKEVPMLENIAEYYKNVNESTVSAVKADTLSPNSLNPKHTGTKLMKILNTFESKK